MEELAPVLGSVGFFAIIGWMIRMIMVQRRQRRLVEIQSELQHKLLDKFSSPQELLEYLSSDAGVRFLQSATIERSNPHARILGSIQAGIILTFAGIAFLFLEDRIADAAEGLVFIGALGFATGIGFLLSGAVAYALSRAWGLMDGRPDLAEGDSSM